MSWIKPEDVQSWRDICEKILGVAFNNGNEITDYPLTKHKISSSYETLVRVEVESESPWMKKPNNTLSISKCSSYGELFAVIYSILMGYAEEEFNKRNLGLFFNQIKPLINNYVSTHRGNGACQPLTEFRNLIIKRTELPFAPNEVNIEIYGTADGEPEILMVNYKNASTKEIIKDIISDNRIRDKIHRSVGGTDGREVPSMRKWYGNCIQDDSSVPKHVKELFQELWCLPNITREKSYTWTVQTKNGKALDENSSLESCWDDIRASDGTAALVLHFSYVTGQMT